VTATAYSHLITILSGKGNRNRDFDLHFSDFYPHFHYYEKGQQNMPAKKKRAAEAAL